MRYPWDTDGDFTKEELFLISEALIRHAYEYPSDEAIHITLEALGRRAAHMATLTRPGGA